jgi:DNA-binding transcriptional regulator YiaG
MSRQRPNRARAKRQQEGRIVVIRDGEVVRPPVFGRTMGVSAASRWSA